MEYILSLDQGTTSSRAVLFDENAEVCAIAQREFTQYFPQVGWVEHDPMEIWQSQREVMLEAVKRSGADPRSVKAIGITNQRETTIVWERASGRPIFNAIVWQCRRTAPFIEKLIADGLGDMIKQKTGLVPDAYFSAAKIRWILDNVEGAREKAERGELCFGTVDSWLIYKLTGGKVHAIDRTNVSRTMLYNIGDCRWDDELPELLGIPRSMLPEVKSSGEVYGVTDILGCEIPIAGVAGDQQAALFGQCCWQAGDVKNTYGTGCFMLMNTGSELRRSNSGLVTTIAATLADEPVNYALEGSVFVGGAVIQWLRDEMKMFGDSAESESLAAEAADNGGVYFVPAFTGLGAPHWDMYARGAIFGITRGTSRGHIVRAALESIAYQSHDLFTAISQDAGRRITRMSVDGGACRNRLLMQFQSDISNIELEKPISHESTALGAAFLAGLTVGLWSSREQLKALRRIDQVYSPSMSESVRSELLSEWHKAVGRSVGWAKKE